MSKFTPSAFGIFGINNNESKYVNVSTSILPYRKWIERTSKVHIVDCDDPIETFAFARKIIGGRQPVDNSDDPSSLGALLTLMQENTKYLHEQVHRIEPTINNFFKTRHTSFWEKPTSVFQSGLGPDSAGFRDLSVLPWVMAAANTQTISLAHHLVQSIVPLRALPHLQVLDLMRNDIAKLDDFRELKELKELDLSDNPISSLKGLEHLKLERLYLAGTHIRASDCINIFKSDVCVINWSDPRYSDAQLKRRTLPSLKGARYDTGTFLYDYVPLGAKVNTILPGAYFHAGTIRHIAKKMDRSKTHISDKSADTIMIVSESKVAKIFSHGEIIKDLNVEQALIRGSSFSVDKPLPIEITKEDFEHEEHGSMLPKGVSYMLIDDKLIVMRPVITEKTRHTIYVMNLWIKYTIPS